MLRFIIQTNKKHTKIELDIGTTEEIEEFDLDESSSTDDESCDCQSTTIHNDVD